MGFLEKLTFEGHQVIGKISLEQFSSTSTFSDFDFRHIERSYPIFSIYNKLQYVWYKQIACYM